MVFKSNKNWLWNNVSIKCDFHTVIHYIEEYVLHVSVHILIMAAKTRVK